MKYTFEQKLEAVRRRLDGKATVYPDSCTTRKAKRAFQNHLAFWVARFREGGEDALRHGKNRKFTAGQKLAAILPVINGKISLKAQSKTLGIHAGTLCTWIRRYGEKGTQGLECSRRRPKDMEQQAKDERRKVAKAGEESVDALKARIAVLEHTVLLQKAELEYRKKLHALAETRKGSGTSTRQGSSTNSAKARDSGDASGSRNGSPSQG